ncbi:hypothetical protein FMM68_07340 [Lachnospiraceae bacterium MD329]|nr:hypothetical protein [Lachnospiraceae bacterium MD329]
MKNKRTTIVAGGLICICLLSGCTSASPKVTTMPTVTPTVIPVITASPTVAPERQIDEIVYIGNKNSKKFHRANCNTLPSAKNRVKFKSRDEAVEWGYSPCYNCQP